MREPEPISPDLEPRPCGECALFVLRRDDVTADGKQWGRCLGRTVIHPVTTTMQALIPLGGVTCFTTRNPQ